MFDVADQLSVQVASRAVGQKLELGDLQVQFVGTLPHYSVYADGHLLGRDKSSFRVLTGKREIVVAKPGLVGDETIKAFTVDITTKKPTVIKVDVTPPKVAQAAPKPVPAAPKPQAAEAAPQTTGRLVVQVEPTSGSPSTIHLDISGPSGHVVLENSSVGVPFVAQLKPGDYQLHASLDVDPAPMVSNV
ncbi:MAG TPA: hypothetical protein VMW69_14880, partial [Spirochaetia bacterium]|nr:hypothetical protein [Spirochaetia bacterium]